MKLSSVAIWAALGMTVSSGAAWALTPAASASDLDGRVVAALTGTQIAATGAVARPEFTTGKLLMMEGRLGHVELPQGSRETYALVNVSAPGDAAVKRAPLNLAIVVDRSGSMRGKRLEHALDAARGMVRRLDDGDVVSVIAYDTSAEVLQSSITLDSSSRSTVLSAISRIVAKGETCISCGIEEGMRQLERRSGMVDRILLLSDGEATAGVKDLEGFRRIGERCRGMNVAVSSIGVDLQYDERVLGVLARESNGSHHFVENEGALAKVFDKELDTLTSTVAKEAELEVALPAGVELVSVAERSFKRDGSRVRVALGGFARGEQKTVLIKLRVAAGATDVVNVADFRLAYEEAGSGSRGSCEGLLSARVVDGDQPLAPLDPVVNARLARSTTATALDEANALVAAGKFEEAKRKLDTARASVSLAQSSAVAAAPAPRRAELARDFDKQAAALDDANEGFAAPPAADTAPGSAAGAQPAKPAPSDRSKRQTRANAERSIEFGF